MGEASTGITIFTWGYRGWGSRTSAMVEMATAIERSRGQAAPIFVDVRRSRDVRADGFRGNRFASVAGDGGYVWMPGLGNPLIGLAAARGTPERDAALRGTGLDHARPLRVTDRAAGDELVDLAMAGDRQERRVIAFCSCEMPFFEGEPACHRNDVAELVRELGPKRGLTVTTVWPGGEPSIVDLEVGSIDSDIHISETVIRGTASRVG